MKKGFTLLELMVVIVIISTATAGTVIAFNNIDTKTESNDKSNIYRQVQNAAIMYFELDDNLYNSFYSSENQEEYISYDYLKNNNYINKDINISDDDSENYYIKIYVAKDSNEKEYLNSCIYLKENEKLECIADSEGNYEGNVSCCP